MSTATAHERALAGRLVLASLTGDDAAFALVMREIDPRKALRLVAQLADCTARCLARVGGRGRAIREVENLIWANLDEADFEIDFEF